MNENSKKEPKIKIKKKYTLPAKKIKISPSRVKRISPSRVKRKSPSRKARPNSVMRQVKPDEDNLIEPTRQMPVPISPPKRIASTPPTMNRNESRISLGDNISKSGRVSKVDFESNKILEKI